MSAYAHQMEREFSAQSLMSREDTGTEMGSSYVVESGFYMTSFAATIFIAALVTFGVLLITLLVTLAVMLQSCENRSKGVVEIDKSIENSYHYCNIFALHGELNSLEANEVPPVCKSLAIRYIKGGQYARDLNFTMWMIENFFNSVSPSNDHREAVLLDIDDVLTSHLWRVSPSDRIEDATYLKHLLTLELYKKLQSKGWVLVLLSRKPEKEQNATIEHLSSLGYSGWSSLIMRLDNEMKMDTREYFSIRRAAMKEGGTQVISVISSQMDALTGSFPGIRIFKLPNPLYYYSNSHIENGFVM
ncbi:Acid phosphatase (Class B) [Corchorus capsularis]|uniref:Acid phosphatase (Class B) n=1 Tax=Corchorus capsularis TaxID=210143 RepID=A0A1R3JAR1_COCAP|nr:Acid phosphatase (Class B) [Corchorus capsularis]